ncbi:MAG: hypothetical protein GF364_21995 [Candidatus Lokiarchaeota archaeon]|nr:hypothetical protein [Candidatus Lokiarchaeota archaeon]
MGKLTGKLTEEPLNGMNLAKEIIQWEDKPIDKNLGIFSEIREDYKKIDEVLNLISQSSLSEENKIKVKNRFLLFISQFDHWNVRNSYAKWLFEQDDIKVDQLRAILNDTDNEVRERIILWIKRYDRIDPKYIEAISNSNQEDILESFIRIYLKQENPAEIIIKRLVKSSFRKCRMLISEWVISKHEVNSEDFVYYFSDDSDSSLVEKLSIDTDSDVRKIIVNWVVSPLNPNKKLIEQFVRDENYQIRVIIANWLVSQLNPDNKIINILANDSKQSIREIIAKWLIKQLNPDKTLISRFTKDEDSSIRILISNWNLNQAEPNKQIIQIFSKDESSDVRKTIVLWLVKSLNPNQSQIEQFARDSDCSIRLIICNWLLQNAEPDENLLYRFLNDEDYNIKSEVAQYLVRQVSPNLKLINVLANDGERRIRRIIVEWLIKLKEPTPRLLIRFAHDEDDHVRETIADNLSVINEPKLLEQVSLILIEDFHKKIYLPTAKALVSMKNLSQTIVNRCMNSSKNEIQELFKDYDKIPTGFLNSNEYDIESFSKELKQFYGYLNLSDNLKVLYISSLLKMRQTDLIELIMDNFDQLKGLIIDNDVLRMPSNAIKMKLFDLIKEKL